MDSTASLHLVVFPWLAFGHILPFHELSKSLAKRGHRVSFISTPRNLDRLPSLPSHLFPLIHLIPLPLPPNQGLPPDAEATIDLPLADVPHLKTAFDGLAAPFAAFLDTISPKPDWIIHDFAHHWLPEIATRKQIPCAFFSVFPTPLLGFFTPPPDGAVHLECPPLDQLTVPPPWAPSPSRVACRLYEARQMISYYEAKASGLSDIDRLVACLRGCSVVAPRDCNEFSPGWISVVQELYKMPVVPVGLLPPQPMEEGDKKVDAGVVDWLDRQSPRSVVYIAFGSEAAPNQQQLQELAHGLELSKIPFLWALKKATPESLPEGFQERTRGRGIVFTDWLPQLRILAHESVGGFLTHCGWSSIIEGVQFGLPFVLLPLWPDQGLIARMAEEKGIGVAVERVEEDGSFGREAVAEAVRAVMVEEEGTVVRLKAEELRGVVTDVGCHEGCVDGFVQFLVDHRVMEG